LRGSTKIVFAPLIIHVSVNVRAYADSSVAIKLDERWRVRKEARTRVTSVHFIHSFYVGFVVKLLILSAVAEGVLPHTILFIAHDIT
jgi:hypothetical protein